MQQSQNLLEQFAGDGADLEKQELGAGGRPLAVAVALVGCADADLHAVRQHVGVDVWQLEEVIPAQQAEDSSCTLTAVPANAGVRRGTGDRTEMRGRVLNAAGNCHSNERESASCSRQCSLNIGQLLGYRHAILQVHGLAGAVLPKEALRPAR